MNNNHRKPLQGTQLEYFDVREAVEQIQPGAYAKLPYTSKVLAEQLVRRCDPAILEQSLKELIFSKQDHDFPWYPARVVCHDILGQTALVDLAGLRDAIADQGGDPSKVNPVVPTQLIVDHSLLWNSVVLIQMPLRKTVPLKTVVTKTVSISSNGPRPLLKMSM
jgi:aconitate hydratase